jgi:predicted NAD-dependent protein-ADP-ribosyltransferase YbiA (DUF1768 family)
MGALIRDKFRRGPDRYRERLLATGHRNLVYRNDHNDLFWGQVKDDESALSSADPFNLAADRDNLNGRGL